MLRSVHTMRVSSCVMLKSPEYECCSSSHDARALTVPPPVAWQTQQYLTAPPTNARIHLPIDFACSLPREVRTRAVRDTRKRPKSAASPRSLAHDRTPVVVQYPHVRVCDVVRFADRRCSSMLAAWLSVARSERAPPDTGTASMQSLARETVCTTKYRSISHCYSTGAPRPAAWTRRTRSRT